MTDSEQQPSIAEDNAYFRRMLDLIPAQLYFSQEAKQQAFSQTESSQPEDEDDEEAKKKKKNRKKNKERLRKTPNMFRNQLVSKIQDDLFIKDTDTSPETADQNGDAGTVPVAPGSAHVDDKRARLRAKIEELQGNRKLSNMQRKKLKKQELRQRQKQKRKELKQRGKLPNKGGNSGNTAKGANPAVTVTPSKPIYNKDGKIVYSKFDFTESAKKDKTKNNLKGKDYKRLLDKIEKRNEKINKLKNKDESAAQSFQEKISWDTALQKAQGEKVKDNPEILKKSLKRKEKIKDKRKKKWENRTETVQKQKDAKQDKRVKHLKERKQAKKEKKMTKMKKKGRVIPGF